MSTINAKLPSLKEKLDKLVSLKAEMEVAEEDVKKVEDKIKFKKVVKK